MGKAWHQGSEAGLRWAGFRAVSGITVSELAEMIAAPATDPAFITRADVFLPDGDVAPPSCDPTWKLPLVDRTIGRVTAQNSPTVETFATKSTAKMAAGDQAQGERLVLRRGVRSAEEIIFVIAVLQATAIRGA